MLYLMRRKDGSVDPYSSGTLVKADGTTKHLRLKDYRVEVLDRWKSPKSGANYPMKWKVMIPSEKIELEISPGISRPRIDHQPKHTSDLLGGCGWNHGKVQRQTRGR